MSCSIAAAGGADGRIQICRSRARAESDKERQRIVQQRVLALEVLDQFLLPVDRCGKPADRRRLRVDRRRVAHAIERIMERVDRADQWIVIAQCADAGREDVAIQRAFQHGEAVDLRQGTIEKLRLGIDRAQRQPAQQQDQAGDNRRGRGNSHGAAPTTGEPR